LRSQSQSGTDVVLFDIISRCVVYGGSRELATHPMQCVAFDLGVLLVTMCVSVAYDTSPVLRRTGFRMVFYLFLSGLGPCIVDMILLNLHWCPKKTGSGWIRFFLRMTRPGHSHRDSLSKPPPVLTAVKPSLTLTLFTGTEFDSCPLFAVQYL
jgi:hypothetical protein